MVREKSRQFSLCFMGSIFILLNLILNSCENGVSYQTFTAEGGWDFFTPQDTFLSFVFSNNQLHILCE